MVDLPRPVVFFPCNRFIVFYIYIELFNVNECIKQPFIVIMRNDKNDRESEYFCI